MSRRWETFRWWTEWGGGMPTDAGSWQKLRLSAACSRRDKTETWLIGVCHWNSAKSPLTERKRKGKKISYTIVRLYEWWERGMRESKQKEGCLLPLQLWGKKKRLRQIPHITRISIFTQTFKSSYRLFSCSHYTSVLFSSSCFVPLPGQSPGRVTVEDAHCAKASLGQTRSIHAEVRWFPAALSGRVGLTIKYLISCLRAFSCTDIIHATHSVSGKLWLVRHRVGPLLHWFDQIQNFMDIFYGNLI